MWKYVVKRLLWMIVVVVGVAFVIFTILYFTPGDPARMMASATATEAEIQALRHKLGIDTPFLQQFGTFLYDTFIKFDLGTSWKYGVPVMDEFANRLPRTVLMGLATMLLTTVIGLPLGMLAATHQDTWKDYGVIGICMVLISLPGFWVSLECIIIFAIVLDWLPAYGIGSWQNYVLPVLCGSLGGIAGNARQMRSSVLETCRADFITTARAKGQTESVIKRKHMLPNAMMPIITMLGGGFAHMVAGSTIMERVFSIPGIGLYLLNGISYRDYPIVRSSALFFAVFSSIMMLLTDLVYAWLDPRIKAQYSSGRDGRRS